MLAAGVLVGKFVTVHGPVGGWSPYRPGGRVSNARGKPRRHMLRLWVSRYTAHLIDSTAQLRAAADAWDDLWRRSPLSRPTLRAEHLAMWLDEFAADRPFRAVVVTEDGDADHLEPVRKGGQAPYILHQRPATGTTSGSQSPFSDRLLVHPSTLPRYQM